MKHVPRKIKDKYEILGIIGEGAYGVVLKARRKESNTTVAIKHFKQSPGYCSDIDSIERELKILQSLRFENVVELIEWFRDKKHCFLVFEYVEWNMLQVLQQHPDGLQLEQVRHLSYQLFRAIHWCHTHEIIHRDIKPENLLISKNFILKLCDFGFARFCNTQTPADYYTDYVLFKVATRWYRSPELLIGSTYGKPVDVWACGCIMAELATGQALFAGESDIDQLYCIQKCLGPLPTKYLETMKNNPKFDGLKFPSIHHYETLERRFGHLFPPDMMHLFKNTLRLHAIDRLTADKCIQHEAFIYLNQKCSQRHRPKSVHTSLSTSQIEHHNETIYFSTPFIDHRLSKSYDENNEIYHRYRSSDNSIDILNEQIKYRSNNQLNDHQRYQPKIFHTQSRTHSSSSNELNQTIIFTPRSSNETSENDDDPRRKYLQTHQIIREQQLPPSPTLRYASNGVLLRPKQQQPSINILQTSSNDMSKRFKRFSLDQQQTSEHNIYRSSMAIVPNHSVQINNNNPNMSFTFKQMRDESNNERSRTRDMSKDIVQSRVVNGHSPSDTPPIPPKRTSSRQSLFNHQIVPDSMDQVDLDSTVSTTTTTTQQQQQNTKYSWNSEHRRPIYGSDSYLLNSNRLNSSFNRPFYSPSKNDFAHLNKTITIPPRNSNHEPMKSARLSAKQNVSPLHAKPSNESNRKQQSSNTSFGVYPLARTAILHVANVLMPSSHQRQGSVRFSTKKSRHQD